MKLFRCAACENIIFFENRTCTRCGHTLGYLPEINALATLEPAGGPDWRALMEDGALRRFCANAAHDVCNWLTPSPGGRPTGAPPGPHDGFCLACRHNLTIPDLSKPENLVAWREIEIAKHRLVYSLLRLRLPLKTRAEDPVHGLAFEFLADPPRASGPKVMTGHDNGLITIALAEADTAERERRRSELDEAYRTLLGHFRHEVGHHYWDILVRDGGRLDACRATFGDDRQDYAAALERHYREGPPADWRERFVSAYAAAHPWEDFAETWAHYLHIVDTLEMASAFGLKIEPAIDLSGDHAASLDLDPYVSGTMPELIELWTPFVVAMNSVNRAMGRPDLYPFVLAPAVVGKLGFIHDLARGGRGQEREARRGAASFEPAIRS